MIYFDSSMEPFRCFKKKYYTIVQFHNRLDFRKSLKLRWKNIPMRTQLFKKATINERTY